MREASGRTKIRTYVHYRRDSAGGRSSGFGCVRRKPKRREGSVKAVTYIARVRGGGGGRGKGRGGEVIDLGGITLPLPRVHLAHGPGEARHDIAAAPGPPSQVCHRRLRPHKPCLLDRPSAQRRVQNLTKTPPPMAVIRCFRKICFILRFRTKGPKGPNSHGGEEFWPHSVFAACRRAPLRAT